MPCPAGSNGVLPAPILFTKPKGAPAAWGLGAPAPFPPEALL